MKGGREKKGNVQELYLPNNSLVENVAPLEPLCSQWHPLQAQVLTNAEEQQCFHAQEFLGGYLEPSKFLRQVPHPHTLAVHPRLVHAVPKQET